MKDYLIICKAGVACTLEKLNKEYISESFSQHIYKVHNAITSERNERVNMFYSRFKEK